jgi:ribonuclease HI
MILKRGLCLIEYTVLAFQVISTLQTEVQALVLAVQVESRAIKDIIIYTDCKLLADAMSSRNPPMHIDWRLNQDIFQLWLFLRNNPGICCKFVGRDNVTEAHQLSNWARICKQINVSDCNYISSSF